MIRVRVHDLLHKRALVTRQSAEPIREVLANSSIVSTDEITLDFSGVDAMTPSFVDELLAILEATLERTGRSEARLLLVNPPTRLSAKFSAVARAREFHIVESEDGTWIVTSAASEARAS